MSLRASEQTWSERALMDVVHFIFYFFTFSILFTLSFLFQHEFERIIDLLTQILSVSDVPNFATQLANHGLAALFRHRPPIHRIL